MTAGPGGRSPSAGDGLPRCDWAAGHELLREYHDGEWGRPVHDAGALFERITLEAFQSGLSWLVILRKRENFRRAFDSFDAEIVAGYAAADVARLMNDPGIVRNRAKIEATIGNARVAADLGAELAELLWSFAPPARPRRPAAVADVPSATPASAALARRMRSLGFRFVGPTTAYALMQATGMVDDHLRGCAVPPTGGFRVRRPNGEQ